MNLPSRFKPSAAISIIAVWGIVVAGGMGWMMAYRMTPAVAATGTTPSQWPAGTVIVRDSSCATLIMLLHPHCPCSRASIHELSEVLSRSGNEVATTVLFVVPPGAPDQFAKTDLWKEVSALPHVTVLIDTDGREAGRFGATTSGQTMLYSSDGRLLFNGGITAGRGHEGDNIGVDSILSALHGSTSATYTTPVYGCSLTGCSSKIKLEEGH